MKLLIGADPEIWIKDKSTGNLISAAGLFPGTKAAPHKVLHGAVQVDGMAAEYNIDPCSNQTEFIAKNLAVLYGLRELIKEHNPKLQFEFVFNPVAEFGAEYIAAQSEETRRLGCDPDFNAWDDGKPNPTPDADMPFRTASGHIHLGWGENYDVTDPEHIEACCMMAKQLDVNVLPYVAQIEGADGFRRRALYGKAGAFRPKPYGMEYRSPSNVWLRDIAYINSMFYYANSAFTALLNGGKSYEHKNYVKIVKSIDKGDLKELGYTFGPWYPTDRVTTLRLDKLADYYCRNAGIESPIKKDVKKPLIAGVNPGIINLDELGINVEQGVVAGFNDRAV